MPYPIEIPLKLSIAIDTRTKKIVSLKLRARKRHDVKDAKNLIRNLPSLPKKILADKGYDAEWLHRYCDHLGIKAVIPMRNYGNKTIYRGKSLRRKCRKQFNKRVYNRREMVESVFSAFKRKFGASVSSLSDHTRRAEIYCRAIAHNIITTLNQIFNAASVRRSILYMYYSIIYRLSLYILWYVHIKYP